MLALITVDASVGAGFLQGAEHHAGVPAEVVELHFEAEIEIPVGFLCAQESVGSDVFAEADDFRSFDAEFSAAVDFFPAAQVFAVEELSKAGFGRLAEWQGGYDDSGQQSEFHGVV